jgi:hypothetical protein
MLSLEQWPHNILSLTLLCYLQQDIARGRGMVDELFQGWGGTAGTQNAIMSSTDYISQAQRTFNNVEDGEATQHAGWGGGVFPCMFPCTPVHLLACSLRQPCQLSGCGVT